jgi:NTE family protein
MAIHSVKTGLVLTAGGARGAYQAGVLDRIGKLKRFSSGTSPFSIITGTSAGAINAAAIAAGSDEFNLVTRYLSHLWKTIKMEQIFRTDVVSFMQSAGKLVQDLSIGGILGGGRSQAMLDAAPLRVFLEKHLPLQRIQTHIDNGRLYAVAIIATNYDTGKSFAFLQGRPGHPSWHKSRRLAFGSTLRYDHIMASTAIPLVFQPVFLRTPFGDNYFGDGAVRIIAPLSPAIRLGADKLFAIGISQPPDAGTEVKPHQPSIGAILGVLLNSIFLDHLESDLEHLDRINQIISSLSSGSAPVGKETKEPLRPMKALGLFPTLDIRKIAIDHSDRIPSLVRYILDGLGHSMDDCGDLMSYIIFDAAYTRDLVALGYRDADARIDEIEAFLFDETT